MMMMLDQSKVVATAVVSLSRLLLALKVPSAPAKDTLAPKLN